MTLRRMFPISEWLPGYRREDLRGDLIAGITVGAMLIPQGMAYALLAGLPPQVGLYAATLPLLVFAVLSRSRHLAIGPTAISSLLAAAGLAPLAAGDPVRYVSLAAGLAVMVGLMRIALGAGRLGFLVNFLSGPVLAGFTSAAALVIAATQLKHVLGVPLRDSTSVHRVLVDAAGRLDDLHGYTVAVAAGCFAALLGFRRCRPQWPGALLVAGAATVLVALFDLDERGVRVVGEVPRTLPTPSWPGLSWDDAGNLVPSALAITLLGFIESIAIAKVFARRFGYRIRVNQELVAVGGATVTAGLVGGLPISGSFSRTAVNGAAGARTQMAGIFSASVVMLAIVAGGPMFRTLPNAALAAIVIAAITSLVDLAEARRLWRVRRSDFAMMLLAFVGTLALGVELGLAVSVAASLALVIRQVSRPHTAVLGNLPGSNVYRNVERYPQAVTRPGLVVLRFDAPLYFANVEFFRERLRKLDVTTPGGLKALVIDASSINDIDASGEAALREMADAYAERGVDLYLAQTKGPALDVLTRSGFYDHLGADRFTLTDDEAVARAAAAMDRAAHEQQEQPKPETG